MAPTTVNLVPNLYDGTGKLITQGWAVLTPQAQLQDAADAMLIITAPISVPLGGAAQAIIANDSPGPMPAGWVWQISFRNVQGNPTGFAFSAPAGPCSFTATNATPCVFTWTPTSAFTAAGLAVMPNGTIINLAGGGLPAGFTATSYYVVNSAGATFQLSATLNGSAIASTSTGSGTFTVAQYELSALAPLTSITGYATAMPVPSGSATSGYVPVATGVGEASQWSPASAALPMTALGDTIYGGASGAVTRLAGNTTATRKFHRQTGTGSASAAPVWDTLQVSDLPLGIVAPSGDTTGSADVTNLQAALTAAASAGGYVKGVPGSVYYLNGTLVISSNTTLDMTGCTINEVNGSNCTLLTDAAHNAGTLTVPSAMNNITVVGGTWDHNNNPAASGLARDMMILGGGNLAVRNIRFQSTGAVSGSKYALLVQNSVNFTIENIHGHQHISDLIHVTGPCSFGLIRNVYALNNKDDTVSFTVIDWVGQQFGNEGDITDVVVDGVFCDGQSIANGVAMYSGVNGGTVLNLTRIKIRNIHGFWFTPAGTAVYLGDSSAAPAAAGNIDDIVIDGIDAALQSASQSIVNVNTLGASTSIGVGSLTIRNVTVRCDCQSVVNNKAAIANLVIEGVTGTTATTAFGGGMVYLNAALGAITRLALSDVNITSAGTQGGSLIAATTSGQAIGEVMLDNVWFSNFSYLASLITATKLYLSNVHGVGNAGVINASSGAAVTLATTGSVTFGTPTSAGAGTVGPFGSLALVLDLGTAGYALVNGTGVITGMSWTAPSDGRMHLVQCTAFQYVSAAETGGVIKLNVTSTQGTLLTQIFSGGAGTGVGSGNGSVLVEPGQTVTLQQTSALTAGTATLFAQIWAS